MTVAEPLTESPPGIRSGLGPRRKADYLALPDEPRCELVFGRFLVSPSPTSLHQTVALALARVLEETSLSHGGFAAVAPLDVTLAEHSVVQPDVIYVSARRLGIVGERIEGAPDLVVEILSPATAARDRGEKLKLYADSGVTEYWIVDAETRSIEFLVNRGGELAVALAVDGLYRSEVLPEVSLDLQDFWSEVDRRMPGFGREPKTP